MSIEANFNNLIFLKKFNNYFNRKIFGGPLLSDYIQGLSGETKEVSLTILDTEFVNDEATISLDIPVNCEITITSLTCNISGYTLESEYLKNQRKLNIFLSTNVVSGLEVYLVFEYTNYEYSQKDDVNFNPNDGVMTEIIVNNISFEPDYLLVLDDSNVIVSRWFILEMIRTRSGQYKLSLKRDVIFDFIDDLKDSPIFVQKGMLKEEDPFIVNDEGMAVNQIKSYEASMTDITECAWIVGYIAKNTPETNILESETGISTVISLSRTHTKDQEFDMFAIPFGYLKVDDVGTGSFDNATAYNLTVAAEIARTLDANCYDIQLLPYCPVSSVFAGNNKIELDMSPGGEHVGFDYIKQTLGGGTKTIRLTREDFIIRPTIPPAEPTSLITGFLYNSDLGVGEGATLSNFTTVQLTINTGHSVSATYDYDGTRLRITISPFSDHVFPTELVLDFSFDYTGTSDEKIGVILYCDSSTFTRNIIAPPVLPSYEFTELNKKESSNLLKFRFVSPNYQGTFELNGAKNNTPNLAQVFDGIKAYCTYKPYTPFIKIAPKFDFLYGQDYQDCRGLICGGDFSLPRTTDAWQSFQLQNKNYQNIFNRDIQNMDFNYNIEMRNQVITGAVGIGTSALGGAAAGAVAGSIIPGIGTAVGAAVGAIGGAAISGVGMAVDTITMAEKYKENKSYAIDKFNYQLGNIKALPYTLTKVGAFDVCSKIWPILEMYHCTEKELEAFRNKIKYESMTVLRIDKLSNYYQQFEDLCYFKGELIRNDSIAADNHLLIAIYAELLKGVYI